MGHLLKYLERAIGSIEVCNMAGVHLVKLVFQL